MEDNPYEAPQSQSYRSRAEPADEPSGRWCFWYGAAVGLALWVLSKPITGKAEPWDGPWWYYFPALCLFAIAAGAISRSCLGWGLLGLVIGQELFMMGLSMSDLPLSGGPIAALFGVIPLIVLLVIPLLLGYATWLLRKRIPYVFERFKRQWRTACAGKR